MPPFSAGEIDFPLSKNVQTDSEAYHVSYSVQGLSPGAKRQEREAHYLPPSTAKFKKERSYISILACEFMACTGTTIPSYTIIIKIITIRDTQEG
jgi:hypothetical protein